ncbi:MAG: hypothetical protein R2867_41980 [Caldilineaceae bacterium]
MISLAGIFSSDPGVLAVNHLFIISMAMLIFRTAWGCWHRGAADLPCRQRGIGHGVRA